MWTFCAVISLFTCVIAAEYTYKLCDWRNAGDRCKSLEVQQSQVKCVPVLDSAHCAILMAEGKADFGLLNAEDLLLAHQFYPDQFTVISEIRHKDVFEEEFKFQTVVVASNRFNSTNETVKQNGFCHPGFQDNSMWNDYILKYFEKEMYGRSACQDNLTVAENEVENLKRYFGKACRPGRWVASESLDKQLKKKYPELCDLCDQPGCKYSNNENYGHTGALNCLTSGRGAVAYVALKYVLDYFANENVTTGKDDFKFICPEGETQPLNNTKHPCAWIKQPWDAIVARKSIADPLLTDLKSWMKEYTQRKIAWHNALFLLLQQDHHIIKFMNGTNTTKEYLRRGRDVELPKSSCGKTIRWCTLNDIETEKCNWVATEATALGIEPKITCNQAIQIDRSLSPPTKESSLFQCFSKIAHNDADIMSVDSNYGYLIRQVYNLSTVLYCETGKEMESVILTVVRDKQKSNKNITSFKDLKHRRACFPEYGGMAWISFLNTIRTQGLIGNSCDYPALVANFFSSSCVPGIPQMNHWNLSPNSTVSSKLCSICPRTENDFCMANSRNAYFGDKGALECLANGLGDVAFFEVTNLEAETLMNINLMNFRVLCKNGSLAMYPGLEVDDQCALSVTIDSEVVSRRNNSLIESTDIKQALLKIENWLGYSDRPVHVFEPFNGSENVLFKDTVFGLDDSSNNVTVVLAYKELFSHVNKCSSVNETASSGVSTILSNLLILSIVLLSINVL